MRTFSGVFRAVLLSWPLYLLFGVLFGDFLFGLESREHGLLALLLYLCLDDALFALQSAFSSSEEPVGIVCTRHSVLFRLLLLLLSD